MLSFYDIDIGWWTVLAVGYPRHLLGGLPDSHGECGVIQGAWGQVQELNSEIYRSWLRSDCSESEVILHFLLDSTFVFFRVLANKNHFIIFILMIFVPTNQILQGD